ncbi:hypothetical protein Hanom_Chr00s003133g01708921 [Helianthus anomalus]
MVSFLKARVIWGPWFSKLEEWDSPSASWCGGTISCWGSKGRSFRIWVEEEMEAWVPDCLNYVSGGVPASMSDSPVKSSPVGDVEVEGSQFVGSQGECGSLLWWTLGIPMQTLESWMRKEKKKAVAAGQWVVSMFLGNRVVSLLSLNQWVHLMLPMELGLILTPSMWALGLSPIIDSIKERWAID